MNKPSLWYLAFYHNKHLLFLFITLVLVAGAAGLTNLPRLEDPRIDNRNVVVLTPYPGASAERVEILITEVLEKSLRQLDEINKVTSTSLAGLSSLSIELQPWVTNANNEQIFSKIRDRISDASKDFPQGAGTPILDDKRGATAFTFIVALKHPVVASENSLLQMSRLSAELADRIRLLNGTELVRVYGAAEEEIVVSLTSQQLMNSGVSLPQISQVIGNADVKQSAGLLNSTSSQNRLQLEATFDNLAAIRALPLKVTEDGAFLTLGDIAQVQRGFRSPRQDIALVDGEDAIFVAARMRTSVRIDQWMSQVDSVIARFEAEFSTSVKLDVVFNQSLYTEARLNELSSNLLLGSAVVILVVLCFMGVRAALIVGLSLPLSAAFAVFSLTFFNQQLHQMTIFGMIIAVGLLIDNAIVITDEIRKRIQSDPANRTKALAQSLQHLSGPLTASTLTTVLAFMPVFLLPGNIGDFVSPIAISVIMALLGSLVLSLTVIAALAARYLPFNSRQSVSFVSSGWQAPALSEQLAKALSFMLSRPVQSIFIICLISVAGIVLSSRLNNVFFPDADRDQFQIYMWLPSGVAIDNTLLAAKAADSMIKQSDDVQHVTWLIGGSTPSVYYNQVMTRDGSPNFANAVVTVTSINAAKRLTAELQAQLSQAFPEAKFVVRSFSQGPPVSAPIAVDLFGPDVERLAELGLQVRLAMSKTTGITESLASITYQDSELQLNTSAQGAALTGLSMAELNQQLFAATQGVLGGSMLEGTEELPIRVKLAYPAEMAMQQLSALNIKQPTGSTVPLNSLGQWQLVSTLNGITRINGERVNKIEAYLVPGATAIDVNNALMDELSALDVQLPAGYRMVTAGDAGEQQQAVGQLLTFLPVLTVLMFATLILTFNSVRYALLVFTVAGLSAGLGLLSLWFSGLPMGFNPLLGLAGLVGVAINGSIVVIAAVNALPVAERGKISAIVSATMGCSRHILSTTVTTVAGLVPLLLFSEGSFWPPLAVVLAGGVGFSIILSLGFTPAALRLLNRDRNPI